MNELVIIKGTDIEVQKEAIKKLKEFEKAKAQMDIMQKELKKALLEAMEKVGKEKVVVDGLAVTYTKPHKSSRLDSKKLREELPEVYDEYCKDVDVSASVRLTISE